MDLGLGTELKLSKPSEVWDHVAIGAEPSIVLGGGKYTPSRHYISFEGNVAWEPEHGLQLVFEKGPKLCKVSPYDGHVTNAAAFADPNLHGVIFRQF
ncbi:MAG: hypothetical protein AAFU77_12520 [Myxococcota bacterium]